MNYESASSRQVGTFDKEKVLVGDVWGQCDTSRRFVDSSSLHWQLPHGSRPVSRCNVQCKYWISFGLVTRCWAAKTEHFAIQNWEHKIRNSQCRAGLAWPRRVFATINKSVICPISDNDTQHHGSRSSSRQRWDQLWTHKDTPFTGPGHKDETGTAINNKTLILLMITKLNIGSI